MSALKQLFGRVWSRPPVTPPNSPQQKEVEEAYEVFRAAVERYRTAQAALIVLTELSSEVPEEDLTKAAQELNAATMHVNYAVRNMRHACYTVDAAEIEKMQAGREWARRKVRGL